MNCCHLAFPFGSPISNSQDKTNKLNRIFFKWLRSLKSWMVLPISLNLTSSHITIFVQSRVLLPAIQFQHGCTNYFWTHSANIWSCFYFQKKSVAFALFLGSFNKLSVNDGTSLASRLLPGVKLGLGELNDGVLFLGVSLGVNLGVLLLDCLWDGEGV